MSPERARTPTGNRGCGFIDAAAESETGTPLHDRTVAHKDEVRRWKRALAVDAGAADSDGLARTMSLLLDGGLASGVLDGSPEAPRAAKAAARSVVALALASSD